MTKFTISYNAYNPSKSLKIKNNARDTNYFTKILQTDDVISDY